VLSASVSRRLSAGSEFVFAVMGYIFGVTLSQKPRIYSSSARFLRDCHNLVLDIESQDVALYAV
jgi:hypothetical protein